MTSQCLWVANPAAASLGPLSPHGAGPAARLVHEVLAGFSCLWAVSSRPHSGPHELLGVVSLSSLSRGHLLRASHDAALASSEGGGERGRERGGELAARWRSRPSVTSVTFSSLEESLGAAHTQGEGTTHPTFGGKT